MDAKRHTGRVKLRKRKKERVEKRTTERKTTKAREGRSGTK